MNDTIITARAKALLLFDDATTVKITEQSKLVIDDFVYDSKRSAGKLAIKVALGTARYTSGQIAKTNPQAVNVQTPTAKIAVRGTDFSMTVDELGRSLIILLPSCDDKGCVTGAIEVSNDVGSVYLDTAYQATVVSSKSLPPSSPTVIKIDQANINNLLIVSPPTKIEEKELHTTHSNNALEVNFLNREFLKFEELDADQLKKYKELDLNLLDNTLLVNLIDLDNQQMRANSDYLSNVSQLLPNYSELTGLRYFFNDDESKITLSRALNHIAQVTVPTNQDTIISITQDGTHITQKVNQGGTATITIIQR